MRIILFTIAFFLCYQMLVWFGHLPLGQPRSADEENYLTAERWRYERKTADVVIVGASKVNFFDYKVLGDNVDHMGFGGSCGELAGLEILKRSNVTPRLILVEVDDSLTLNVDQKVIGLATSPQLGDVLSGFRHQNQPAAVALGAFEHLNPDSPPTADLEKHLHEMRLVDSSNSFHPQAQRQAAENAARIRDLLQVLSQRGAKVVLLDPPAEDNVSNSRFIAGARKFVRPLFPSGKYAWFPDLPGPWYTIDGVHLTPESGHRYSLALHQYISTLLAGDSGGGKQMHRLDGQRVADSVSTGKPLMFQ